MPTTLKHQVRHTFASVPFDSDCPIIPQFHHLVVFLTSHWQRLPNVLDAPGIDFIGLTPDIKRDFHQRPPDILTISGIDSCCANPHFYTFCEPLFDPLDHPRDWRANRAIIDIAWVAVVCEGAIEVHSDP